MVSAVKVKHTLYGLQSEHDERGRAGILPRWQLRSKLPSSSGVMTMRGKCQVCKHKQEPLTNDAGRWTNLGVRDGVKGAVQFAELLVHSQRFPRVLCSHSRALMLRNCR